MTTVTKTQPWIEFLNNFYKEKYSFTDKETYLIWVQNWKKAYKEISDTIRDLRISQSNHNTHSGDNASKKHNLRVKARFLMDIRMEGKTKSAKMKKSMG